MFNVFAEIVKPYNLGGNHGSPADRGSADAYYGRACSPHFYPEGTGKGVRITRANGMTEAQVAEYIHGYKNQHERKEWA